MPAFDTHKAVKALCSAGFDDTQAEAVVDQINGAINENVATKTDLEKLPTKEELRQEIAKLATKVDLERCATKEELHQEVDKLATKAELREEVAKLATKAELREEVAKLATKRNCAIAKLRQEVAKLELRIETEIEKQSSKYLRSMVVVVAGIVGLAKALELLWA